MNEALLKVEYKKEKAKGKQAATRTNPTIAAMEIMTRKEIQKGEMERRLARGELPQIPVPATPVHMKDQNIRHNNISIEGSKLPEGKAILNNSTNTATIMAQSKTKPQPQDQGDHFSIL